MEAMKNQLVLEEKFGGFRTEEGVEITSYFGGIDVFVGGADGVGMDRYMPKCKDRSGKEVAILAVLAESAERQALIDDQEAENNPYLVEVGVEVEPCDGECFPAQVPEDAVTLVLIVSRENVLGYDGPATEVVMFPPD